MADDLREQIVELVRARFESIRTANSYETDLGANVFIWRDLNSAPASEAELPLLNVKDIREETDPMVSGRADHHHTLFMECEIAAKPTAGGGNIDAAKQVRKCLADIKKAINTTTNGQPGPNWANSGGTKLVFLTLPMDNEMVLDQSGRTVAGARLRFKIEYRTQRWNQYLQ